MARFCCKTCGSRLDSECWCDGEEKDCGCTDCQHCEECQGDTAVDEAEYQYGEDR